MKFFVGSAFAIILMTVFSGEAQAWACRAGSPTGSWGLGTSYNVYSARRRALLECAVRTPRGYRCYVTGCG